MYFTTILGVLSDGRKLRPYVIFKKSQIASTKKLDNPYPNKIVIRSNQRGWISEDLMIDWIDTILLKFRRESNELLCLILDKCTVHTSEKVISYLETN